MCEREEERRERKLSTYTLLFSIFRILKLFQWKVFLSLFLFPSPSLLFSLTPFSFPLEKARMQMKQLNLDKDILIQLEKDVMECVQALDLVISTTKTNVAAVCWGE